MIDLFLLVVTIANCILFVLVMDCFKKVEQYYETTKSYFYNVEDHYKHLEEIYNQSENVYQIITEQYDEVAKLMGWRNENG
jgi:hypothetical protein